MRFSGGDRAVVEGPFPESKQLIAGYWILQVPSMEEAVEWAKRAPFEALARIYPGEYGATGEVEVRRVFELEQTDASLVSTRGHLADHVGLSVADLDAWVAKLRSENVKFLEPVYKVGDTRAVECDFFASLEVPR